MGYRRVRTGWSVRFRTVDTMSEVAAYRTAVLLEPVTQPS